jgi:type II secretory pathway component PulK
MSARARLTASAHNASPRRERGIVLAIVLVMIFALITAVYAFQRRAIIDTTISRNRIDAAEADALAKGGLRIAEALVAIVRAKQLTGAGGGAPPGDDTAPPTLTLPGAGGAAGSAALDALWQGIGGVPIEFEGGRTLRIEIEDEGAKLNLNSLVAPEAPGDEADGQPLDEEQEPDRDEGQGITEDDEAVEYLATVLEAIVDDMEGSAEDRSYDTDRIARNILDFMDADSTAIDGRSEDEYYRRQDPPYRAWNRPFVSVDQLGLVEDVDPPLLEELRHYVTVHPVAGSAGINLNRAPPWVLKLVYSGTSGNRGLIDDKLAEDLIRLREKGKLVCDDQGADPRCVARNEVGNGDLGNGSIYPEASLPAQPTVFRVVASAQVGNITRRFEAIYDTRPIPGPQLLSWRRLRGND